MEYPGLPKGLNLSEVQALSKEAEEIVVGVGKMFGPGYEYFVRIGVVLESVQDFSNHLISFVCSEIGDNDAGFKAAEQMSTIMSFMLAQAMRHVADSHGMDQETIKSALNTVKVVATYREQASEALQQAIDRASGRPGAGPGAGGQG